MNEQKPAAPKEAALAYVFHAAKPDRYGDRAVLEIHREGTVETCIYGYRAEVVHELMTQTAHPHPGLRREWLTAEGKPIFGAGSPRDVGEHLERLTARSDTAETVTLYAVRQSVEVNGVKKFHVSLCHSPNAFPNGECLGRVPLLPLTALPPASDDTEIDALKHDIERLAETNAGLLEDLHQLIRVALTNPGDVAGFIEANYPAGYARHRARRPAEPCRWSGGNDYLACGTCHREYDYRKEPRPACPLGTSAQIVAGTTDNRKAEGPEGGV